MVDQNVTDLLTYNHHVGLEATRLELHGLHDTGHVNNRGRVRVVRPLDNLRGRRRRGNTIPVRTPDTTSEVGVSPLDFAVDQELVGQHLCASSADVQSGIFVSEGLEVEVGSQREHVSRVGVLREGHTNTRSLSARCARLDLASAVEVCTVVDVVLVGLLSNRNLRENTVGDKAVGVLQEGNRQVGKRCVDMNGAGSQHSHL